MKLGLLDLLPTFPADDIDEKAKTIEMLFAKENILFGNPLAKALLSYRAIKVDLNIS